MQAANNNNYQLTSSVYPQADTVSKTNEILENEREMKEIDEIKVLCAFLLKNCKDLKIRKLVDACIKDGYDSTYLDLIVDLDLSGCQLDQIPSEISKLKNLFTLRLVGCKLRSLPESLSELKKLKVLNLQGNRFTSVPDVLLKVSNLSLLYLANNPDIQEISIKFENKLQEPYPGYIKWVA